MNVVLLLWRTRLRSSWRAAVALVGAGLLVTVVVAEAAAIVPATIARRAVLDRTLRSE